MKGAFATKEPSGANSAQLKSSRSLMLVEIAVCCSVRPIASATLMNRFAKSVSRIGSTSDMMFVKGWMTETRR